MYRLKIYLLLGFIVAAAFPCLSQDKAYSIAFYNVENLFDTTDDPAAQDEEFTPGGAYKYTGNIYSRKLKNIARVIADMADDKDKDGPDIIGLAEVENEEVLKDLTRQEAIKNRYRYILFCGSDIRGINTAVLYSSATFKPLHSQSLTVPAIEPTRNVLYVVGLLARDTIHVLVNHWPSRREGKEKTEPDRLKAAAVNRKIIDSVLAIQQDASIIVMGDFNDNPTDKSIETGLNAHATTDNSGMSDLHNPWTNTYLSGAGSSLYKKHWDLFDQIILSYGMLDTQGLQFKSTEIFKKNYLFTQTGNFKGYPHRSFGGKRWINGYSDHLPVILYFSITNK